MLQEIKEEAAPLDRSLSMGRAARVESSGRGRDIKKLPSVNDINEARTRARK